MSSYQWDASDYSRNSSAQFKWAVELMAKYSWKGDERVLDVGCGDGRVSALLAAKAPAGEVVGVDNSPEMIELAQNSFGENHVAAAVPNLRFELLDARCLPFDNEFDLVFSNAALHWIVDHQPIVQGIAAALKPGGHMLVQMGGEGNAAAVTATLQNLIRRPAWSPYFQGFEFPYGFYDPQRYRSLLARNRMQTLSAELIEKTLVHESPAGLAGWIRTTWLPYTERTPADQRNTFIEEFLADYLQDNPLGEDGKTQVKMVRLEVYALKPPT